MPEVCVSNCLIVTVCPPVSKSGKYLAIESSRPILPCSCSFMIAAAVNCLVTEPMRIPEPASADTLVEDQAIAARHGDGQADEFGSRLVAIDHRLHPHGNLGIAQFGENLGVVSGGARRR